MSRVILPGCTIGIFGGGQLGRMIALKAREMGYRVAVLDPTPDCPCGQVADEQIVASYEDLDAARRLAAMSDVLTYEFENVDDQVMRILERESYLPQGGELLRVTRHRIREKRALVQSNIPVTDWQPVASRTELQDAVKALGVPCVLKTTTGGYDGKGQFVLRHYDDVEAAWKELGGACELNGERDDSEEAGLILEAWFPFEKELSVIAARRADGVTATFPTAENIHRDNILHLSLAPARIHPSVDAQARELASRIAQGLGVVGLIGVEMFWREGDLRVNELAPRPHNSGHYTMDACVTSQFEQHIRAICHLPLGDTRLLSPVAMVNILGQHVEPVLDRMDQLGDTVKIHLYGKAEAKTGRKIGHLNVLDGSVDDALAKIADLAIWDGMA